MLYRIMLPIMHLYNVRDMQSALRALYRAFHSILESSLANLVISPVFSSFSLPPLSRFLSLSLSLFLSLFRCA